MPASHVDGSVFQSPQRVGIGSGLQALSEGVNAIAVTAAEKQGRDDAMNFQRDENGNIQPAADEGSFILGDAGKAYQHAFNVGTLASMQGEVDQKMTELRQQFPGDVTGYKIAAGKYLDSFKTVGGALGPALFNHGAQVSSQHAIGIMNDTFNSDTAASYQAITTRLTDLKTQVGNMARGVQTDDVGFLDDPSTSVGKSMAEMKGYYQSLVDNPNFKKEWTQEKADSEIRRFRQEAVNNWALGNAQRIRNRDGIDAAVQWSEKNVRDSETNMPFNERLAAHNMVLARITTLTESQKAQARASSAAVDGFAKLYSEKAPPTEEQYEAVLQSARKSFDVDGAARLQAFHDVYHNSIKPYASLSPHDGLGAVMGANGAPIADARDMVRKFEGYREAPYWDVNHWRVGFGSDTVTRADGKIEPVTAMTRITRADAERDLERRTAEFQKGAIEKVGADAWGKLTPQARVSLTSVAYNYGELPDRVVDAVRSGDPQKIGAAIEGLKGDNGGVNSKRRSQEAAFVTGGAVAGASSPVPFTPDQIKANPYLAAAAATQFSADRSRQVQFAKDQAEVIGRAVSMGAAPDLSRVAQVLQLAEANPRELGEVATKLRAQVAAAPVAMMAAGSPDGGQSYIAQAEDLARSSPDLFHMELASALKTQIEGRAKALNDDPHAYAARSDVGWIRGKPLPFQAMANPSSVGAENAGQVFSAAIAQRREAGFQIGPRLGVAPEAAMFTTQDLKALTSGLQASDGAGADMILRGLQGQLHPQEMAALAGNKEFSNAVAGLTRSGDPQKASAAYGFLDKQWRENPEAFKKEFGADMATKLAVWQDKLAFMPPDQAMREMQKANDPSTAQAVEARRDEADKITKDLTSDSITKHLFATWGWVPLTAPGSPVSNDASASSSAMLADYRAAYRDLYAESGDKGIAEKRAVERLQLKWGASDLNGGRVMAYPPERYYLPDVNGSRKYVTDQLEDAIHEVSVKMGAGGVDPLKVRAAPRALIADQQTQEDIANRRAPSYRVIVQDDTGRWLPLEARPGTPLRFFADRESVVAAQSERAAITRRQSQFVQGAM